MVLVAIAAVLSYVSTAYAGYPINGTCPPICDNVRVNVTKEKVEKDFLF